jgi:hypothetical protein
MRSRTRNSLTPGSQVPYSTRWTTCSETNWVVSGAALIGPQQGVREQMDDVVSPNFNTRVSRGEVFFNPMNHTRHEVSSEGQGYHQVFNTSVNCSGTPRFKEQRREGDLAGWLVVQNLYGGMVPEALSTFSTQDLGAAITEVSTRVLADRGTSDSNLFESVAQLDQALGLQHDLLKEAQRLVDAARRTKIGRAAKSAASLYLAYRYGIKPIMSDLNALRKGMDTEIKKTRKSTHAQVRLDRFSSSLYESGTGHVYSFRTNKTESVTVRATSLDEYIMSFASESGFSEKSLYQTPWELVPFSFVLDWFVNFGDFYGSLLPSPGYTQLGSCITVLTEVSNVHNVVSYTQPGYGWTLVRPASGTVNVSSMYKSRGGLGIPGLVVKSDFRLNNLTRCADAVALLLQKMRFR